MAHNTAERTNVFETIARGLANAWTRFSSHFSREGSEESALAAEMGDLDKSQPDWDIENKLAGVRNGLKIGVRKEVITAVYGDNLTRQALGRPASEPKTKSVARSK